MPTWLSRSVVRFARATGAAIALLSLTFLVAPTIVVGIMSFNGSDTLGFPPTGWSWRWYQNYFTDPGWLSITLFSLQVAMAAAAIALLLGGFAAWWLAEAGPLSRRWLTSAFLVPLIVPPVVLGVGFYRLFAQLGWIGSDIGLILTHAVLGLSYAVVILLAAFGGFDRQLLLAASSLGAGKLRTVRQVIAPLIIPSLVSAFLFTFLTSFDEVVLTSFVGGATARTLPMRMWEDIRHGVDPTIAAISTLLVLATALVAVIAAVRSRPGKGRAA